LTRHHEHLVKICPGVIIYGSHIMLAFKWDAGISFLRNEPKSVQLNDSVVLKVAQGLRGITILEWCGGIE